MDTFGREHPHNTARVKDAIYELRDDLEEAGKRTAHYAKRAVHEIADSSRETLEKLNEARIEHQSHFGLFEQFFHRHPTWTLLLSVCVGILLGQML